MDTLVVISELRMIRLMIGCASVDVNVRCAKHIFC